jgi:heterotetrameric sarcosine oxidase gamma subunit
MSLEFLSVEAAAGNGFSPVARSPMEPMALAAGGRTAVRDGWSVVTGFASPEAERDLGRETVGFADSSHLAKLEVQAEPGELEALIHEFTGAGPQAGEAIRHEGGWWCPLTPARLLVIAPSAGARGTREELGAAVSRLTAPAALTDVTSVFAAMTLIGPAARETIARFCALDLRPHVTPVGGLRPGSIARQPGILVREAPERYLLLFGWAVGQYLWTVVHDAAGALGGGPVGAQLLEELRASDEGVAVGA